MKNIEEFLTMIENSIKSYNTERPITNTDSNDGELHLIDGVSESVIYDSFSEIYATTSVRDLGVIIGERDEDEGWSINVL